MMRRQERINSNQWKNRIKANLSEFDLYLSAVHDLQSSCFLASWGACNDFNDGGDEGVIFNNSEAYIKMGNEE